MGRLIITGGKKLKGEILVEGSKNAVLPILAATVLNGGINIIKNCPALRDVDQMLQILKQLGCNVVMEGTTVFVDSSTLSSTLVPENLASEMRSSIFLMGPLLARCHNVTISYPGGCVASWAH